MNIRERDALIEKTLNQMQYVQDIDKFYRRNEYGEWIEVSHPFNLLGDRHV